MVRSDGGVLSCTNRMRNEGIAITTRINTGTTVQTTSISVLWVVRDGVGLARALNLTITMIRRASTRVVIAAMIQSTKSWNQMMSSTVGVTDFWHDICHGLGWLKSADAVPPAARAAPDTRAARAFRI